MQTNKIKGKCTVCGKESDDLTDCCDELRCESCYNAHVEMGLYEGYEEE